jgi:hypothetical protein
MSDSGPVFVTGSSSTDATSEDQVHALDFKAFVKKGTIPQAADRAGVMQYVHGLAVEAAMRGDYAQADHYSEINKLFYEACVEKDGRESVQRQLEAIEDQMAETRRQTSDLKAALDAELAAVEKEEREKIEKMKVAQLKELNDFDEKWASEDALRPFSKPSPLLTELREKEKKLLLIKEFTEAAAVGKYADSVEKEETKRAQILAEKEAVFLRRQLMERHEGEIAHMEARARTKLAVMRKNRDEKLEILTARMAHIEIDKLNVRRSKTATTESVSINPRMGDSGGMLSPRSHSRLEAYRKQSVVSRLVLKPVRRFPAVVTRQLRLPKYKKQPLR